jgi:hypothetical protein
MAFFNALKFMDYTENFKELLDLKNLYQERRVSWLRYLALLVLSLIGLLAGLHTATNSALCVRVSFVLTILLFSSGLLLLLITLYNIDIAGRKELLGDYSDKLQSAYRSNGEMRPVFGGNDKKYDRYEKYAYILLILAVIALSSYIALLSFA